MSSFAYDFWDDAIGLGLFVPPVKHHYHISTFPELQRQAVCPAGGCTSNELSVLCSLAPLITHLNDVHEWSREEIADWVEREVSVPN